jgi:WD40 repeat protein
MANGANPWNCCFSPDGKLVAVSEQSIIHVWDITSSDPHLIETFHEGFGDFSTILFSTPSSLISVQDNHIKFWQIGPPSIDLAETDPEPTSLISAGGNLSPCKQKMGSSLQGKRGTKGLGHLNQPLQGILPNSTQRIF